MDKIFRIFDSQIKEVNVNERSVVALVSTGAQDRHGEVMLPEGADFTNFRKNPVVMWAHDYKQPPIGRAAWVKSTADGVLSKVIFAKTAFADEIFNLYKDGFMKAFSVGFIPMEHINGNGKDAPSTTYTKWEMIEYSAVPIPANPEALSLAIQKGAVSKNIESQIKSFEKDIKESNAEPKEMVEPEPKENINQMEIIEPLQKELIQEKERVKNLMTEVAKLSGELFNTRVMLLELYEKLKANSEISGDELVKTVNEVFVREIRKVQGKLD